MELHKKLPRVSAWIALFGALATGSCSRPVQEPKGDFTPSACTGAGLRILLESDSPTPSAKACEFAAGVQDSFAHLGMVTIGDIRLSRKGTSLCIDRPVIKKEPHATYIASVTPHTGRPEVTAVEVKATLPLPITTRQVTPRFNPHQQYIGDWTEAGTSYHDMPIARTLTPADCSGSPSPSAPV